MNKVDKFLQRLSPQERQTAQILIARLIAHDWAGLNIRKLGGQDGLWRLRHGNFRISFQDLEGVVIIIRIGRRNESPYKF